MIEKEIASLTVIIPVYNTVNYLEDTINSVLEQDIADFEILLVDDCSTDGSGEIAKRYENQYDEISCITLTKNQGQSHARNTALKVASKDYIYFLDSDDMAAKGSLKEVLQKASRDDLDALFFDGQNFSVDFNLEGQKDRNGRLLTKQFQRDKSYGFYNNGQDLLADFVVNDDFYFSPSLYIAKRDLYHRYNLTFTEGIINEDNLFTVSVHLFAKACAHVSNKVLTRRLRPNSTMTTQSEAQDYKNYQSYYQNLLDYEKIFQTFTFVNERAKDAFSLLERSEYNNFIKFSERVKDEDKELKLAQAKEILKNHKK